MKLRGPRWRGSRWSEMLCHFLDENIFEKGIDFFLNRYILLSTVSDWREPRIRSSDMKYHKGQWAKDYSFARVECGNQGHGKSTSPNNMVTDMDMFLFFLAVEPENVCSFCAKSVLAKVPKRAARVARMAKEGATIDDVRAESARLKAEKEAA